MDLICRTTDSKGHDWVISASSGRRSNKYSNDIVLDDAETQANSYNNSKSKTFHTTNKQWLETRLGCDLEDLNWTVVDYSEGE